MADVYIWVGVWVVILIMLIISLAKIESRIAEDRINKMFEYLKERKGERMANYTDTDALSKKVEYIKSAPTADVVEVVRCEKCKWQRKRLLKSGHYWYECANGNEALGLDGEFCSDGERRAEDD